MFCDPFDHMTVTISGRKIHPAVDAARIRTQRLFDETHCFDKLAPVHCAQKSQAGNTVADGHLGRRLFSGFGLHQLLDRLVRLGEQSLDPAQR